MNKIFETGCKKYVTLSDDQWLSVNKMYTLENPLATTGGISFAVLIILVVTQAAVMIIIMMQRTNILGEIIIMLNAMVSELQRFFTTFVLIIFAFMVAGRLLGDEFQPAYFPEDQGYGHIFRIFFTAFMSHPDMSNFVDFGKFYMTCFMFIFKVLLLSLLASMFINRYRHVYNNLEAIRL